MIRLNVLCLKKFRTDRIGLLVALLFCASCQNNSYYTDTVRGEYSDLAMSYMRVSVHFCERMEDDIASNGSLS